MKNRYFSFDLIKGIGILGVIIFHRLLFDYIVTYRWSQNPDAYPSYFTPILIVFFVFLSMAGIFFLISGIVNTLSFHRRSTKIPSIDEEETGQSMRKSKPRTLVIGSFVAGIYFLIFGFLYEFLFAPSFFEDYEWYGLLNRGITTGEFVLKEFWRYLRTTALGMIGITLIISTLIMLLITRKEGYKKVKRNTLILLSLAIIFLISPILLREPLYNQIIKFTNLDGITENNNYFLSIIIALLGRNQFPIFPYLAYGFLGAILGIWLFNGVSRKKIKITLGISSIVSFIIGGMTFVFAEDTSLTGLPGYSQEEALSYALQRFLELGLFFLLILIFMSLIDFQPDEKKMKRVNKTRFLRRFGMMSLTIFTLEGPLAAIYGRIFTAIYPDWRNSIYIVLLFVLVIVLTWHIILVLWEKVNYAGSLEWILVWLIRRISGKKSDKLNKKYFGKIEPETSQGTK
jgi:hypothetical protein